MKRTILVDVETGKSYDSEKSVNELLDDGGNVLKQFNRDVKRVCNVIKGSFYVTGLNENSVNGMDENSLIRTGVVAVSFANANDMSIDDLIKELIDVNLDLVLRMWKYDSAIGSKLCKTLGF